MKRLLTRNLGWKLFSLAIAAFLWLTYARDPELGTFISVPVVYKAMPDELEIGSDLVASVSLDVRGASDKVHAFSASRESSVLLDFSGILKPGEHTFQIDEHNVKLPTGVRLIRAIPSQIRLQFERRVVRQVPVQVRFAGVPQKGYSVARHVVTPSVLEIVGPELRTSAIEFVVTDPIDLAPLVAEAEFRVNAFAGDPHVRLARAPKVVVRVFMEKK